MTLRTERCHTEHKDSIMKNFAGGSMTLRTERGHTEHKDSKE